MQLRNGLFRGQRRRDKEIIRQGCQVAQKSIEIGAERFKTGKLMQALFIHIEASVDLDLESMASGSWSSIMLGDKATRIGLVVRNSVTQVLEEIDGSLRQPFAARTAETVADNKIRSRPDFTGTCAARHGVAVYQHRIAKTLARGLKQSIKRLVIRLVE